MTDKELKKHLKKLSIVFLFIILLVIVLSVYTLGSTKANLSIYDKSEYTDNIKVLGINEDELKQYLSIVGNLLIDEKENEKVKMLDMATNFIDTMCSSYEPEINENGQKYYDANIVNQVIKEINGNFIRTSDKLENAYVYSKEENVYFKNEISDKVPYCLQIEDIIKNEDEMEITYQLAYMTNTQMAEYKTGKEVDVKIHTIKVTISNHVDYEYSKYFVNNIEELNNT